MSMDEHYSIDTPENIEFNYTVAGIGSRFLAAIVDTLLLGIIQVALAFVMGFLLAGVSDTEQGSVESILLAIWALLSFVFLWGYYIFFELSWNGQSLGKRLVRLRVVREGGRPITFVSSAIRNLVRLIDFLPGFYGLGVLVMFIDKRARRLGDLAGGTLVVKEQQAVSLESLMARSPAVSPLQALEHNPLPLPALSPNMQILTGKDYELVQEFLRRRSELGRESRMRLGKQLAEGLHSRLGIPFTNSNPELFLEQVVREYRLSRGQMVGPEGQERQSYEQGI